MSHASSSVTADQALSLLKEGNAKHLSAIQQKLDHPEHGEKHRAHREGLTKGQSPYAIIVCCSDSRFPPEILFNASEGKLFVVRTAGHVVGRDAAGSIEYAVEHLGSPLIVVLGHDKCGAVTAAVTEVDAPGHIFNVIERIHPAVEKVRGKSGDQVNLAIDQHVRDTVEYLKNMEPICKKFYKEGKLKIVGARCDINSSEVTWLD